MRVLIIAHDEQRARHIAEGINWRGFRCDLADTLSTADADLDALLYDVIIFAAIVRRRRARMARSAATPAQLPPPSSS